MSNTSNYALRLLSSLKTQAEQAAREEGSTLNQFINIAVAEKLAALRTSAYITERAKRADLAAFDRFMAREGGAEPRPGDELP